MKHAMIYHYFVIALMFSDANTSLFVFELWAFPRQRRTFSRHQPPDASTAAALVSTERNVFPRSQFVVSVPQAAAAADSAPRPNTTGAKPAEVPPIIHLISSHLISFLSSSISSHFTFISSRFTLIAGSSTNSSRKRKKDKMDWTTLNDVFNFNAE